VCSSKAHSIFTGNVYLGTYSEEGDDGDEFIKKCNNVRCVGCYNGFCNIRKEDLNICSLEKEVYNKLKIVTKRDMIRTVNMLRAQRPNGWKELINKDKLDSQIEREIKRDAKFAEGNINKKEKRGKHYGPRKKEPLVQKNPITGLYELTKTDSNNNRNKNGSNK
jgi:hypothetical protein